jgi:hypothetical protein
MMGFSVINLNLEKDLLQLGAVRSFRALHYQNFVINETYLESYETFFNYCAKYAFDNSKEKHKRIIVLKLSTKVLNYSK